LKAGGSCGLPKIRLPRTRAQPSRLAARGSRRGRPARALQRRHDMLLTSWVFTIIAAAWLVAFVLVVGFLWLAARGDSAAQGHPRLARKPNTVRQEDDDRAA